MIYAQVDDEGLKLLRKELKSTKDAKWYKRLKIIQLSSQGEKVHNGSLSTTYTTQPACRPTDLSVVGSDLNSVP